MRENEYIRSGESVCVCVCVVRTLEINAYTRQNWLSILKTHALYSNKCISHTHFAWKRVDTAKTTTTTTTNDAKHKIKTIVRIDYWTFLYMYIQMLDVGMAHMRRFPAIWEPSYMCVWELRSRRVSWKTFPRVSCANVRARWVSVLSQFPKPGRTIS